MNEQEAFKEWVKQTGNIGDGAKEAWQAALEYVRGSKRRLTDDYGRSLCDQRRLVAERGKWRLLYDQHVLGNTAVHQFVIQKITHDVLLYPGITLQEAMQRFEEIVGADNE